ncbi:MAG TPA: hypothetical protein VFJ11_10350 [Gaiellaceae bacterium]|nr:hypothetical protein [Gaiellaceae bacterium]
MRRALLPILVTAVLAGGSPAAAGGGASLTVAPKPGDPTRLTLVAHLPGSAGEPVAFFVVSKEFGSARNVPIGVTRAGADGTARMTYTPTWSGTQQFVVKLARPGARARSATAEYRVTASKPGPLSAGANPPRPLASVGHVFLTVILTIVTLIWLSLLITLALAFGRLPRLAGADQH